MRFEKLVFGFCLVVISYAAHAGEWQVGGAISISSGVSEVADLYEDNIRANPWVIDVDVEGSPIGASFRTSYQTDQGVRVDLVVGPLFLILGDADHSELPVSATVGYNFTPSEEFSPYVRLGLVHHIASGDYVESSSPGLLVAVGLEFNRNSLFHWGLELSVDDSTVEFEDYTVVGNTELNTYDKQLTVFFMFGL